MANVKTKIETGINIVPSTPSLTEEGDIAYDGSAHKLVVRDNSSTGNVVEEAKAATLTNKSLDDTTTVIVDTAAPTKRIKFDAAGTAGTTTTILSSQTTDKTLTLPDATDTVAVVGNITTHANLTGTSAHGATSTATASQIVVRDGSANIAVNKTVVASGASGGIDVATAGDMIIGATVGANKIKIGASTSTIEIEGSLDVKGTVTAIDSTTLTVVDPLITLNKGGGATSAGGSGIEIEENTSVTGYVKVSSDRNSMEIKAPNTAGIASLTPGASNDVVTLNAATQALTNKSISDALTYAEIATPAKPTASKLKLYAKSDDKFYYLNSSGTETELGVVPSQRYLIGSVTGASKDYTNTPTASIVVETKSAGTLGIETWTASGNLNTARHGLAGAGTQNAAVSFGGTTGSVSAVTETFNGNTWTNSGTLNTARQNLAGCGTQTAGLSFGGYISAASAVTETFNGSTWTNSGALNTARTGLAGCGTQTAGLSFGGNAGGNSNVTETFNGNTWTNSGTLNTARQNLAGCGTQTAGLSFGGGTTSAVTEKFNGATWATSGNLNIGRGSIGGTGTQNAAVSFGGYTTGYKRSVEKFNTSAWTVTTDIITAKAEMGGAGTQNVALMFGGDTGSNTAVTEKFIGTLATACEISSIGLIDKIEASTSNTSTVAASSVITFTPLIYQYASSAELTDGLTELGKDGLDQYWTTSGNLNTARTGLAGCGTQTAGLSFGGYISAASAVTETFNGSTWTASGALNTARYTLAGCGTQTAGLSFGGTTGSVSAVTEKFNGATWATSGALNTARYGLAGAGTQTAGLSFGGGGLSIVTEKFNGSTWTVSGNMNTGKTYTAGCGTQTAAVSFGGTGLSAVTETFNGSTWTASGNLNTARSNLAGTGTLNASMSAGGNDAGGNSVITEKFNGSTWITNKNLNTARQNLGGTGTQNTTIVFGGSTGSNSNVTEKYTSITAPSTTRYNTSILSDYFIS